MTVRFLGSRFGLPDSEAEEIAQQAWVQGFERLEQLRDQRMLRTWVNSIAKNLVRVRIRRQQIVEFVPLQDGVAPPERSFQLDLRPYFLSKREELIVRLAYEQGFNTKEIRAVLPQMTGMAIRIALTRARRKIRAHLQNASRPH